MKKKLILGSALGIIMCSSLITGATMALFTSESNVNIAITTGKVDVVATVDTDSVQTKQLNTEYADGVNNTYAGGVTVSEDGEVTLDKFIPGDGVKFNITIENNSTVDVKYQTVVSMIEGIDLFDGLEITINNELFDGMTSYSSWNSIAVGATDTVIVPVAIELPDTATNEYQGKTCKISFAVNAVQGNATVSDVEVEENTTYIYTVSDLQLLAKAVNGGDSLQGETVKLMNDIDLNGVEWTPIGMSEANFKGTFDGDNHVISNVYINDSEMSNAGLFGIISSPAVVKNVVVENATITAKSAAGALFGNAFTGSVENCVVRGDIEITANYKVGGMAGEGYAKFSGCSVNANAGSTVTGTYSQTDLEGDNVGGLIGYRGEGNIITENCTVTGLTVSGTRKVGGLIGSAFTDNKISGCTVQNVTVHSNATAEYVASNTSSAAIGGIVGLFTRSGSDVGYINDCTISNLTLTSDCDQVVTGQLCGGCRGSNTVDAFPPSPWSHSGNTVNGTNFES